MVNRGEHLKENVGQGELAVYTVFNSGVAEAYNDRFSSLVLPQAVAIDTESNTLTMPYYEGETFNEAWNISNGGAPMDLRLAKDMPRLLKDLSQIDSTLIVDNNSLAEIPRLVFDYHEAAEYFSSLALKLIDSGVLSYKAYHKVREVLTFEQTTAKIVNNGDFYPRNIIKRVDGKLVLIDWETWNDHSPFYIVDHPENVAAVAYVHMWGNPAWYATYLQELDRLFGFSEQAFQKGVVIKALTLASFFPKHKELLKGQIEMIRQVQSWER